MNQNNKIDKFSKSIFSVAQKHKAETEISELLDIFNSVSNASPKFKQFLITKQINIDLKIKIINNIFDGILSKEQIKISSQIINLIDLRFLKHINKKYKKLHNESLNLINVIAVSSKKLNDSDLSDISSKISEKINKTVSIKNLVDKSILGGIKLKVGNTLIDGSISNKLKKLKHNMINK